MYPSRPGLVLVTAAALAGALIGLGRLTPAAAETGASASTDPTGAHVELDRRGAWVETPPRAGSATTPTGCQRRWIPSGAFELRATPLGDYRTVPIGAPQPGPEYSVYQVWCATDYLGAIWARPQQFGVDPAVIAERLVRDLPYPAASVAANPATRGLTGLATTFRIDGYTTAPITDVVREFGMEVEVEAVPDSVSWDFGDDTTRAGASTGTRPVLDVTHTFEIRARPTFPVRALIVLAVRWRLNGGPWQDLDPVVRTALLEYPVVESRAVLVPDS